MAFHGDRLRAQRILKGYRRQDQLAKALRTETIKATQAMISRYETGKEAPSVDMLTRLADVLSCSVDYLLGRVEYAEMLSPGEYHWLMSHRTGDDTALETKLREAARNRPRFSKKK